jgi:hypothetical protein
VKSTFSSLHYAIVAIKTLIDGEEKENKKTDMHVVIISEVIF